MKVFRGLPNADARRPCALTIGNFDGVHLGHKALLTQVRDAAQRLGIESAVMTFEPHPREFFAQLAGDTNQAPPRVANLRDKLQALEAANIDRVIVEHFNARFAGMSADDFIQKLLVEGLHVKYLIVGDDFRFGAKRAGDFHQLLAENVNQYNGIADELHTTQGIFDKKGAPVKDKKTKEAKTIPDPKWLLFEKCMRGDTSDNVFSAYPGVRTKGTKNKVGLQEAFEDKDKQGYNWNNMMLQRWLDHNGEEHRVLNDYERNKQLIDLKHQPADIKDIIRETIKTGSTPKNVEQVGMRLLKFCGLFDLVKISEQAQSYAEPLNAKYPELN